jgi:MFS family permease
LLQYGIENAVSVLALYTLLVLSRAIYGVFGSGTPVAAQAYIADRTSRSERSKGVAAIGAAFGFGAILGPGFAAVLAVYSLFLPFYLLALIGFFGFMSTLIFLTERRRPEVFENIPEKRLRLNDKRISGLMIIGAGTSFVQAILLQISAFFVLDVLHLNAQETTSLVGIGMMGMAIMTLFSQLVVIPRLDPSVRTMLISGAVLLVIPFCMFLLPMSKILLVTSMVISGFGFGLIRTGTAAGASLVVNPEEQGAVAGLIGATAAIGIIFVPVTAMALYSYVDPTAPYILGLIVSAFMLYLVTGSGFRHMNRVLSQDTPIL